MKLISPKKSNPKMSLATHILDGKYTRNLRRIHLLQDLEESSLPIVFKA
jgi:hypothetical protein